MWTWVEVAAMPRRLLSGWKRLQSTWRNFAMRLRGCACPEALPLPGVVVASLAARSLLCPFTNDTKIMHLVQQGDRSCVWGACRALTRRRAIHDAYSAVSYDKTRSLRHGSFRFLNRQP